MISTPAKEDFHHAAQRLVSTHDFYSFPPIGALYKKFDVCTFLIIAFLK